MEKIYLDSIVLNENADWMDPLIIISGISNGKEFDLNIRLREFVEYATETGLLEYTDEYGKTKSRNLELYLKENQTNEMFYNDLIQYITEKDLINEESKSL